SAVSRSSGWTNGTSGPPCRSASRHPKACSDRSLAHRRVASAPTTTTGSGIACSSAASAAWSNVVVTPWALPPARPLTARGAANLASGGVGAGVRPGVVAVHGGGEPLGEDHLDGVGGLLDDH